MYTGHVSCCPLVSYGEYADGTDRQTDARPLHYIFCCGHGPCNEYQSLSVLISIATYRCLNLFWNHQHCLQRNVPRSVPETHLFRLRKSRSRITKNIAGVGLCTLVRAGFFWLSCFLAPSVYKFTPLNVRSCTRMAIDHKKIFQKWV